MASKNFNRLLEKRVLTLPHPVSRKAERRSPNRHERAISCELFWVRRFGAGSGGNLSLVASAAAREKVGNDLAGFSSFPSSFVVQWICERSGDRKTDATVA
jgi:hypothetical protein